MRTVFVYFTCSVATYLSTATLLFAQPATTTTTTQVVQTPTTTTQVVTTPTTRIIQSRPTVITTTVPAPLQPVVIPSGFVRCFTVTSGWYNEVWVAQHQVCQYANSPEGALWVEGYWSCHDYSSSESKCTHWRWKPAHWEKSTTMVY